MFYISHFVWIYIYACFNNLLCHVNKNKIPENKEESLDQVKMTFGKYILDGRIASGGKGSL